MKPQQSQGQQRPKSNPWAKGHIKVNLRLFVNQPEISLDRESQKPLGQQWPQIQTQDVEVMQRSI